MASVSVAAEWLSRAIAVSGMTAATLNASAVVSFESGDYAAALRSAQRALAAAVGDAPVAAVVAAAVAAAAADSDAAGAGTAAGDGAHDDLGRSWLTLEYDDVAAADDEALDTVLLQMPAAPPAITEAIFINMAHIYRRSQAYVAAIVCLRAALSLCSTNACTCACVLFVSLFEE